MEHGIFLKVCTRCKTEKPMSEFGIDKRRNAPKAICRPCDSEIHKERSKVFPLTEEQKARRSETAKNLRERKRRDGVCQRCGKSDIGYRAYCDDCRELRAIEEVAHRAERRGVKMCPACGKSPLRYRRRLCDECTSTKGERFRAYQKAWRENQKLETFEHYGGCKCSCCGESNPAFLTIDHPNNDGADHRRKIFPNGKGRIYGWLRSHGYPAGFRVLCFNCNCGREYNGGICPHELARQSQSDKATTPQQEA